MAYYRTQREKDLAEARLAEAFKNLPKTVEDLSDKHVDKPRPTKKLKRRKFTSGYRLGEVMPKELRDKAFAYRRRKKSGKLRESNNKGDQYYGKRSQNTRPT